MLLVGRQQSRHAHGWTRRAVLQAGASSVLGLSLADMLRLRASGVEMPAGPAKAVILLWLWGGPAQLDTWDPKPNAPMEYRGPFTPIATKVTGIRISELFPQTAEWADHFSILRSLHTGSNDHGVAGTIGLTGSIGGAVGLDGKPQNGAVRPALGRDRRAAARPQGDAAALPRHRRQVAPGQEGHRRRRRRTARRSLRPLPPGIRRGQGNEDTRVAALRRPDAGAARRSAAIVAGLRPAAQANRPARAARSLDDYRAQAFALLTSPEAQKMFDLESETKKTRDRYGRTRFGQSCLLARRLVEQGVPFVQVNWSDHVEAEEDAGDGGWDNHYRNFQLMQDRQAPWLDQSYTALLGDLKDRGLLDSTLVLAVGEFGRTPKINDKAGRDHWEHCYSALVAGGGVRGGRVVGSSDARGGTAARSAADPDGPRRDRAAVRRHLDRGRRQPRPAADGPRH